MAAESFSGRLLHPRGERRERQQLTPRQHTAHNSTNNADQSPAHSSLPPLVPVARNLPGRQAATRRARSRVRAGRRETVKSATETPVAASCLALLRLFRASRWSRGRGSVAWSAGRAHRRQRGRQRQSVSVRKRSRGSSWGSKCWLRRDARRSAGGWAEQGNCGRSISFPRRALVCTRRTRP